MKTENSVSKTWDDMVFENRNHEYGAYAIRKSYSDNVLSGAFFSILTGVLVLLIPFLSSMMRGESVSASPDLIKDDLPLIFTQKPLVEVETRPEQVQPVRAENVNLPPRVTTEITETVVPTNTEVMASLQNNSDAQVGEPVTTSNVGVGIIEPPVIVEPSVFIVVEVMPEYEGGLQAMYKFIQKKMRYPGVAERNEIQGTVYVSFVVDASGKVVDVGIVKGVSADLDKEAARVIAMMPGWKAGKQHDKNVSVRMTLPIKFQLNH
ncbi:MAG: TonB family protein [Chryseolinea sp.]